MNHWRTVLPITIHEVDYEEVVADLEPLVRRLLTAVGLDWDPACLDFHRTRRPIRSASFTQVRQPLYKKSVCAGSGTNTRPVGPLVDYCLPRGGGDGPALAAAPSSRRPSHPL